MGNTEFLRDESRTNQAAAMTTQRFLFPPATAQPQEATAHGEDTRAQSVASPSLPSTVAGLVSDHPSGLTPAQPTAKLTTHATGSGGPSLPPESVVPPSPALSPELSGSSGPEMGGRRKAGERGGNKVDGGLYTEENCSNSGGEPRHSSTVLCHCLKCGEWWRTELMGFECPGCGCRS